MQPREISMQDVFRSDDSSKKFKFTEGQCYLYSPSYVFLAYLFFFSSRRRHTRSLCDWNSDVCSSDLTFLQAGACLFGVVLVGVYFWARHLGITIIGWLWWLWDCVKDDSYNIVLPGHPRFWALDAMNAVTPLVVLLGSLAIAFVAVRVHPSLDGVTGRRRLRFWYLFLATTFNTIFYLVVANYAFG